MTIWCLCVLSQTRVLSFFLSEPFGNFTTCLFLMRLKARQYTWSYHLYDEEIITLFKCILWESSQLETYLSAIFYPFNGGEAGERAKMCPILCIGSSKTCARTFVLTNILFQVKQIMEEAVTRKYINEDSSSITSLCGEQKRTTWSVYVSLVM